MVKRAFFAFCLGAAGLGAGLLGLTTGPGAVSAQGTDMCAAPTLVHHYVAAHRYAPPEPFVRAVLDSGQPFT